MELGSRLTEVFFFLFFLGGGGGYFLTGERFLDGSGLDVSSQDYGVLSQVNASLDQHPIDLTTLNGILRRRN
jgi:hypothetical protein